MKTQESKLYGVRHACTSLHRHPLFSNQFAREEGTVSGKGKHYNRYIYNNYMYMYFFGHTKSWIVYSWEMIKWLGLNTVLFKNQAKHDLIYHYVKLLLPKFQCRKAFNVKWHNIFKIVQRKMGLMVYMQLFHV